MRYKGKPLDQVSIASGSWTTDRWILEAQAARSWGLHSMSEFWALGADDKAIIVALHETEMMMQAIEIQAQNKAKKADVNFGQVEG